MLWLVVDFACAWIDWPLEAQSKALAASSLLHNLIIVAIGAAIAVPWHRRLLLGELPSRNAGYTIDQRVLRYAVLALALAALFEVPWFLFQIETPVADENTAHDAVVAHSILSGLFWMSTSVLLLPAFLVLPARALNREKLKIRLAYQRIKGNFWRLNAVNFGYATALFLLVLLFLLVGGLFFWRYEYLLKDSRVIGAVTMGVVATLFTMPFVLTFITFLSLAYRHFFSGAELSGTVSDPRVEDTPSA